MQTEREITAAGVEVKSREQTPVGMFSQYHPDVNMQPGATEKFKEIGAAYEVLSDDERGLPRDVGDDNRAVAGATVGARTLRHEN